MIKTVDIGVTFDGDKNQDLDNLLNEGYRVVNVSPINYDGEVWERWTLHMITSTEPTEADDALDDSLDSGYTVAFDAESGKHHILSPQRKSLAAGFEPQIRAFCKLLNTETVSLRKQVTQANTTAAENISDANRLRQELETQEVYTLRQCERVEELEAEWDRLKARVAELEARLAERDKLIAEAGRELGQSEADDEYSNNAYRILQGYTD
jgi:hypothetical protein